MQKVVGSSPAILKLPTEVPWRCRSATETGMLRIPVLIVKIYSGALSLTKSVLVCSTLHVPRPFAARRVPPAGNQRKSINLPLVPPSGALKKFKKKGGVAKWSNAFDCKSNLNVVRTFESCLLHILRTGMRSIPGSE